MPSPQRTSPRKIVVGDSRMSKCPPNPPSYALNKDTQKLRMRSFKIDFARNRHFINPSLFPSPLHFKRHAYLLESLLRTRTVNSYLLFIQYSGAASSCKYRVNTALPSISDGSTPKIGNTEKDREVGLISHHVVLNNIQQGTSAFPTSSISTSIHIPTTSFGRPAFPWKGKASRTIEGEDRTQAMGKRAVAAMITIKILPCLTYFLRHPSPSRPHLYHVESRDTTRNPERSGIECIGCLTPTRLFYPYPTRLFQHTDNSPTSGERVGGESGETAGAKKVGNDQTLMKNRRRK